MLVTLLLFFFESCLELEELPMAAITCLSW